MFLALDLCAEADARVVSEGEMNVDEVPTRHVVGRLAVSVCLCDGTRGGDVVIWEACVSVTT